MAVSRDSMSHPSRMSIHKEIAFEEEICEHVGAHGWIYVEGDSSRYDRARAIFPDDVLAWVQGAQAQAWEALGKNHRTRAGAACIVVESYFAYAE